jgi:UDP-2,3-diacylglucosamine pyrophosphatase LpxH
MKILILSDFHLGNHASKGSGLLDGIARIARGYDRVILNGDTLDRYENPELLPKVARDLEQVTAACTSRSGPPEILTGNHDPLISKVDWLYIKEGRTLIFHGDCITDVTHPTDRDEQKLGSYLQSHWAKLGGRPARFADRAEIHRKLQGEHLRMHPRYEGGTNLQYLLRLFRPISKPLGIVAYLWHAPRRAAELAGAHDEPVEHIVVGHTHHPGTWRYHGRTVMNTGSFMPLSAPSAVVIADGKPARVPLLRLIRTQATTVHMAVGKAAN